MKSYALPLMAVSSVLLTACASSSPTTRTNITPPTVVISPDFRNLPTKSCVNGEYIHTPATLVLDTAGKVTQVLGVKVKDKQLAQEIIEEFKKAQYTPYLKDGVPLAHHLNVAVSLKCPHRSR